MTDSHEMRRTRALGASLANAEDASIWRWFAPLLEEHRIRWCLAGDRWIVSVDNTYAGTDKSFDLAIRLAKQNVEKRAPKAPKKQSNSARTLNA